MGAIFKREFKAYFSSVIGWLFLAAFFFIFDLYLYAYNLLQGSAYLSTTLQGVTLIFVIIIPLLTMRSMSEDRKTKTDQLLYTAPVSVVKVILGKFFAMVSILSIAMAAVCIFPLFLSAFGTIAVRESYVSILGTWLFGVLTIAIGLFLSAITESMVIAAVMSFALLFLGYMMTNITQLISSSGNLLTKVLNCLAITSPLTSFNAGTLSVTGIVYYITGAALFLFLTCQLVQKFRWSVSSKKIQRGVFNSSFVIIGIVIVIVINLFANQLPENVKGIDMTYNKLYTITSATDKVLDKLKKNVTIYVLVAKTDKDTTLDKTLNEYVSASGGKVKVSYIDPAASPNFYTKYATSQPTSNSLIVVCGSNSKVIDYNDVYETTTDSTGYSTVKSAYDGEGQITSAINYVTNATSKTVYAIQGHGETTVDSSAEKVLTKDNFALTTLTLLKVDAIPDDAAAIVINGPTSDFSSDDAKKVLSYLKQGGKVLITTSYSAKSNMKNFDSILSAYGMSVTSGMVMESDTSSYYQYPYLLLPTVGSSTMTTDVSGYVLMPYAQAIVNANVGSSKNSNLTWTSLLTTSNSAYIKSDVSSMTTYAKESGDKTGQFSVAASVTNSKTNGELTVVGSYVAFTESADEVVSGHNMEFFKDIAGTFVSSDSTNVSIDAKKYSIGNITVNQTVSYASAVILIVVLPVILLIAGIIIWMRRRRA